MGLALVLVLLIGGLAWIGASSGLAGFLGIVLPYIATIIFIIGLLWRLIYWSKSPVPFKIPTTGGQEKSLSFIKPAKIDCPDTKWGLIVRMFLEVFCFRSLFRNTSACVKNDGTTYYSSKWLWVFALLFHYCFLLVFIRHFRFFIEPVPSCIVFLETLDGIMQVGTPRFFWTGGLLAVAILFLIGRRIFNERLRYLSLLNDYFPLFLLLAIVGTGICLRYFDKAEIAQVKIFIMGVTTFSPISADGINAIFFVHLTLVCTLLIYFPFSKLVHMPGVFYSPTRNMTTDTRITRHINPWNPPKQYFTYPEYEDMYRDAMAEAGLPLEKQPTKTPEGA